MSVIVRTPTGKLRLYCKGAVSFTIFSLYQRTYANNANMPAERITVMRIWKVVRDMGRSTDNFFSVHVSLCSCLMWWTNVFLVLLSVKVRETHPSYSL